MAAGGHFEKKPSVWTEVLQFLRTFRHLIGSLLELYNKKKPLILIVQLGDDNDAQ